MPAYADSLFVLQVCMQCLISCPTCLEARVSLGALCQRRRWCLYWARSLRCLATVWRRQRPSESRKALRGWCSSPRTGTCLEFRNEAFSVFSDHQVLTLCISKKACCEPCDMTDETTLVLLCLHWLQYSTNTQNNHLNQNKLAWCKGHFKIHSETFCRCLRNSYCKM